MEFLKELRQFKKIDLASFKQQRWIFQQGPNSSQPQVQAPEIQASGVGDPVGVSLVGSTAAKPEVAAAAEVKKAEEKAKEEVKTETDLTTFKASMDIKELQKTMQEKAKNESERFFNAVSLDEKDPVSLTAVGGDFKSLGFKQSIQDRLKPLLNAKKELATATEILNNAFGTKLNDEGLADFMSAIYANDIANRIAENFKRECHYRNEEFLKSEDAEKVKNCEFAVRIELKGKTDPEVSFKNNKDYEAVYKKFLDENKTAKVPEKKVDASTGKAFREKCKFGAGVLVAMGFVKQYTINDLDPDDPTMLTKLSKEKAEMLTNESFAEALDGRGSLFAGPFIWLFGGASFLSDGGKGLADLIAQGGEGVVATVNQMKTAVAKIPLFKGAPSKDEVAADDATKKVMESAKPYSGKEFAAFLNSDKTLGKEGLKLTTANEIIKIDPAKQNAVLKLTLDSGGELIIPKDADVSKLEINQARVSAAELPKSYTAANSYGFLEIKGTLPSGTVIMPDPNGKVYMELDQTG
ncbi:MAG: hypothetical protein AAB373_01025 [Patescibacteria group bacterium]